MHCGLSPAFQGNAGSPTAPDQAMTSTFGDGARDPNALVSSRSPEASTTSPCMTTVLWLGRADLARPIFGIAAWQDSIRERPAGRRLIVSASCSPSRLIGVSWPGSGCRLAAVAHGPRSMPLEPETARERSTTERSPSPRRGFKSLTAGSPEVLLGRIPMAWPVTLWTLQ